MAASPVLIAQAASLACNRNAPVLGVDTCSLLDVVRAPFRPKGAQTVAAAEILSKAQSAGKLTIFMAPSVPTELARNYSKVRNELDDYVTRVDDDVKRIAECLTQCGSPITVLSLTQSGIATAIETRYATLVKACELLDEDDSAKSRATDRAVSQRRPSRKGNVLDANVIEHYFALGRELQRLSFGHRFVFVSSNTMDYCEARTLHPDLSPEFLAISLQYTDSLPWARRALGL